ncbi:MULTISPECIES: DNA sulfur modification protein DndD [Streptomyces]|uniref:DNA sulfur modification protein DndD n=1 Tax=Streptomyces TaxID=1883 RepID=UPI001647A7C0|nr:MULTISPECIES: DNA sulfur modification protein DndD [Streptomyces]MBT3077302.1 DNA sulfur modification protein DndD [Streptomyces sp. COG21]MBT3082619.1 DNA sulfur modification protein DndD [Streptomyces sp. COG20]MBT3087439.1 DNA sulfur modification protein DndD [Streptomyces sp. CYG21]MBT3097530.1 DNA sulfur modification protein DndD [Streptomyces sp. CBG30]MBT3110894.1 DNA sulfur modification protein DndD [Streptomyces sp. CYG20]
MHLHSLTLQDFGAYQGRQHLDLRVKPKRPIILIGGLNGCGKTTLLDAIQLVLYGPRARCSGRGSRAYETYLRESINRGADSAKGAALRLEFSITVEGRSRTYEVDRAWALIGKNVRENLAVSIDGRYDATISENWAEHVEEILPLEVASLFFFDGEKVEQLADPERAAGVIEAAVHSLLGVRAVEQLRTDLLVLQRRQRLSSEDRGALEQLHDLKAQKQAASQEVSVRETELDQANKRHTEAEVELKKIERQFKRAGGHLFEDRLALEAAKAATADRLAQTQKSLRGLAEGAFPLVLLRDQLATLMEQAVQEQDAHEARQVVGILESRDAWLIDQLPDSVPAAARTALKKKLTVERKKRAAASALGLDMGLPDSLIQKLSTLDEVLRADEVRATELLEAADKGAHELQQAERQLAAVPDERKIKDLIDARQAARDEVTVARAAVEQAAQLLAEAEARQARLAADFERTREKQALPLVREEELKRVATYAEKARATLESFGSALLRKHISSLQVAVLISFQTLMRKSGLIKSLRIDTDKFTIALTDQDGEPVDPSRLSAGERQLLAVSLLWGLAKVAGNRLPTVIDTPLGRLDSRHREHLVDRYFPNAGRQVLLLSTDEEIDENLLNRLRPSIAQSYVLAHDDTTFTTRVGKGYWWTEGALHAV